MPRHYLPSFPLRVARVHEICGPAAFAFTAITTALTRCTFLWVHEAWRADRLHPAGFIPFLTPSDLLLVCTRNQTDSLAVAEEALRDGTLPFVVIEITRPLNLREGRRLQLAAKSGSTTGLCIIPEGMGSNAAETRWRATPIFDPEKDDSTLMRWEIIKNKSGTPGAWNVRWNPETHRLHVVSALGNRAGTTDMPS